MADNHSEREQKQTGQNLKNANAVRAIVSILIGAVVIIIVNEVSRVTGAFAVDVAILVLFVALVMVMYIRKGITLKDWMRPWKQLPSEMKRALLLVAGLMGFVYLNDYLRFMPTDRMAGWQGIVFTLAVIAIGFYFLKASYSWRFGEPQS